MVQDHLNMDGKKILADLGLPIYYKNSAFRFLTLKMRITDSNFLPFIIIFDHMGRIQSLIFFFMLAMNFWLI